MEPYRCATTPELSSLEGYRVSKKGIVINEDAEEIGRVSKGKISELAGKKINEKGEVLDQDGNVLGEVVVSAQVIQDDELSNPHQDISTSLGRPVEVVSPLGPQPGTFAVNEGSDPESSAARHGSLLGAPEQLERVNILGLFLPAPTPPGVTREVAEHFRQCHSELEKLYKRNMSEIEKPITCIDQAFESFKNSEQQLGEDHLVKPSGSLTSKLIHLLNQPSFTTLQSATNPTADENNPCTRMIMENLFSESDTMMMDYVHRRSCTSEDIVNEGPLLERHEKFTESLLASAEAKVILAHGIKVRRRLLSGRKFDMLPLWDVFEGIALALEHEQNYSNADPRYKYRRIFLFAQHPNSLMWQQRGNPILKLHDQLSQISAKMTNQEHLLIPEFFAKKLWSRDSVQRSKFLRTSYKASQQVQTVPLHLKTIAIQAKQGEASWETLFDDAETHNNRHLQDEILPEALEVWKGIPKPSFNWNTPGDLPFPVLRWIQGSRYALFGSGLVPDSEDELKSKLCQLAFPERTTTDDLRLDEILQELLINQQKQVSDILHRQKNLAHLLHSGVGQVLQIQCPRCGWKKYNKNPQWAVKWPGHYYTFQQTCKDTACTGARTYFIPVDGNILRTPSIGAYDLNKEGHEKGLAFRSCLRAYDDPPSGTLSVIECWCFTCKAETVRESRRSRERERYFDRTPRWTLGQKFLFVENALDCRNCGKLGTRFVPVDEDILTILPQTVKSLAPFIAQMDPQVKGEVMDAVLQPSSRVPRKSAKTSNSGQ